MLHIAPLLLCPYRPLTVYLYRLYRRDVDVDYDVGMESAGRYGTRANRALATRAGASRAQVGLLGVLAGWGPRGACVVH